MSDVLQKVYAGCLRAMLKPVAKYCLKRSLTIQDLITVAKSVLIETAADQIKDESEAVNFSRLSIMTGIHRQEVKRIYTKPEPLEPKNSYVRGILGQWEQDKNFLDEDGNPKVLSTSGKNSEFKKLVKQVTLDVNPATVLFELQRLRLVEETPEGVKLARAEQFLQDNPEEGMKLIARDTEDLSIAIEENLVSPDEQRNLHGRTIFDNIYADDMPKIKEWLLDEGSEFHRRARDFLAQFDKDINPDPKKEGGSTVIVGNYSRMINESD